MPDVLASPLAASRVSDFVGTIGVNVHLLGGQSNAWDTQPIATVIADLTYLGVGTIRDNVYNLLAVTPRLSARYNALAQAGFTFDFTVGSSQSDLSGTLASLDAFALLHPGAIRYVEGPNEINYNPFTYQGQSGQAAAIAFQRDLSGAVHVDPLLAGIQILDFTGGGLLLSGNQADEPVLGIADLPNIHVYPAIGDPPDWYIAATGNNQYGPAFSVPFVTSEAGYNTDPNAGYGVPEDVAAKYTLDLLLDTARAGSVDTMLYELFDLYADPGLTTYDDHWGLFYADGTPKPAASAIHNLVTLLSDAASTAPLDPKIPAVSLTGLPDAGRYWLLQKNSQTFDLVVWSEPALWNPATHTEMSVGSSTVSIGFDATFAKVRIFDPMLSSAAIESLSNVDQLSINLSDHPLVIEFALDAIPATESAQPPLATGAVPPTETGEAVYRFFSMRDGSHLFTTSETERDTIVRDRPDLVPEGIGFRAFESQSQADAAIPVFRFFDMASGTHFYTASADERDAVLSTRPELHLEGISFYVHSTEAADEIPVWRFFDTSSGTHLYSSSPSERASILADRPDLRDEGVAFYVPQ